jgi:chromosome segregation ATPase
LGLAVVVSASFNRKKVENQQLTDVLDDALKEKEALQTAIADMERRIAEKEAQISDLSDVQAIKQALSSAQQNVEAVNQEMDRVIKERAALQDQNLSLTNRLQNTTKEYIRVTEELRKAKDDVSRLTKEANPNKSYVASLTANIQKKDAELVKLRGDISALQANASKLVAANKSSEKRVKELESERAVLESRIARIDKGVSSQSASLKDMQDTIDRLKNMVERKEDQIRFLQEELDRAGSRMSAHGAAAAVRTADAGREKELDAANMELRTQLSQLIKELTDARVEAKRRKTAQTLQSDTRADGKIADLLVRKELELDTARREAVDFREKNVALQAKIANLENTLATRQSSIERVRELENQRLALESKISDLQSGLSKKTELADNLQQNIEYLNKQVSVKDEEQRNISAKLAALDSTARQDIEKERARYNEINVLYTSLKTQVTQFSQTLTQKQAELEKRNDEIFNLRQDLASVKAKTQALEVELAESKDRQRKTLDDLVAAVRLNTVLQERLAGGVSDVDPEEKKRADELRKKVEVILEPEK